MIFSEVARIFDISWIDIFWFFSYLFIFMGLYTGLIIGYARSAARRDFIKNTMPDLYDGKLRILLAENKRIKKEYQDISTNYRDVKDRMKVIKKSMEI